jgi:hypothetical protein
VLASSLSRSQNPTPTNICAPVNSTPSSPQSSIALPNPAYTASYYYYEPDYPPPTPPQAARGSRSAPHLLRSRHRRNSSYQTRLRRASTDRQRCQQMAPLENPISFRPASWCPLPSFPATGTSLSAAPVNMCDAFAFLQEVNTNNLMRDFFTAKAHCLFTMPQPSSTLTFATNQSPDLFRGSPS